MKWPSFRAAKLTSFTVPKCFAVMENRESILVTPEGNAHSLHEQTMHSADVQITPGYNRLAMARFCYQQWTDINQAHAPNTFLTPVTSSVFHQFTTFIINTSPSHSLPSWNPPDSQIHPSIDYIPFPGLPPRTGTLTRSSLLIGFGFQFLFFHSCHSFVITLEFKDSSRTVRGLFMYFRGCLLIFLEWTQ